MGKAISAGISAVAVGSAYDADGDHSIRQNEYVNASGLASSAFGSMARAHADYATALGSLSHATGLNSTAVGGGWDDLNGDGVVDDNEVTAATGENASAFGSGAQATADDTIASGAGSRADVNGSKLGKAPCRERGCEDV